MMDGLNRVLFGDCRASMRELIADGVRVQCCVTSPPYWGLRDYGVDGQIGLEPTPGEYVAHMVEVFGLVRELLADDGVLWLNLGDTYNSGGGTVGAGKAVYTNGARVANPRQTIDELKPKDLVGIPWRVAFALQNDGWYLRSDIIWNKPNPMPESVTDRPTKSHEYIFLLAKAERYFYDADAVAEPIAEVTRNDRVDTGRFRPDRGFPGSPSAGSGRLGDSDVRNKRSVWTVATVPFSGAHFATFPPALIEPCILAGSRPGDVVIDPFMGSGTTAQVAQRLGRNWVGCELNEAYRELQDRRTAQQGMVLA